MQMKNDEIRSFNTNRTDQFRFNTDSEFDIKLLYKLLIRYILQYLPTTST